MVTFEKAFFDQLKDIFEKGIEEKGIEGSYKDVPLEFNGFQIDLPRNKEDMYHGSSYEILCNRGKTRCKIKGDLVAGEGHENDVIKTLELADCKIFGIHTHIRQDTIKPKKKEHHIHFICQDRDKEDTKKMIHFLKIY